MSVYRVATANTYDRALFNIQQRQTQLGTSQDQLSSGKRVLRASDDAVAATLSERTQNRLLRTESDQRGVEASRRSLAQAEGALASATEVYARAKELVVKAGNGVLSASDRSSIANELVGLREELLGLANQKDSAGKPLFAGLGAVNIDGQSFVEQVGASVTMTYGADGRTVAFDGMRGQTAATETGLPAALDGFDVFSGVLTNTTGVSARTGTPAAGTGSVTSASIATPSALNANVFPLSEDDGRQGRYDIVYNGGANWTVTPIDKTGTALAPIAVTAALPNPTLAFEGVSISLTGTPATGDQFQVIPGDHDIFETLDRGIYALTSGLTGAALTAELGAVNQQLGGRQDQLLTARGKLGDWLNRADTMETVLSDRVVAYEKENSELTDLDMVSGISNFQKNQTAYQAALQSYAQVQKMSMFDYLR